MIKNSFIDIISTFSKEEIADFRSYLNSPYFKVQHYIIPYYEEIIKFHNKYESEEFTKEFIFKKIYPEKKYDDNLVRKALSLLTKEAERFLVHNEVDKNDTQSLVLLNSLMEKGMFKKFNSVYENYRANKNKYFDKYFLTLPFLIEAQNVQKILIDKVDSQWELPLDRTIEFLILNTMSYQYYIKNISTKYYKFFANEELYQKYNNNLDFLKTEEAFKILETLNSEYLFLMKIYHHIDKSINGEEVNKNFSIAMGLFQKNTDKLTDFMLFVLSTDFESICILEIQKGFALEYKEYLFNLYKFMIENNIMAESKTQNINVITFRNMLLTLCKIDLELSKVLIENYVNRIELNNRGNMKEYAYAHYYMYKKDFSESLNYIRKIKNDFFMFKTDIKFLYLINFYELEYFEEARYQLKNTYQMLKTMELNEGYKELMRTFLDTYKKMIDLREKFNKEDWEYLVEVKSKDHKCLYKDWLFEKIELLVNK